MSEIEFEQAQQAYAEGRVSRRRFINRLIAGGVTVGAAVTFADVLTVTAGSPGRYTAGSAALYGNPAGLYGTPPGQGGTPPGQGGTPPPFSEPPPGQGGTPPGQGGTPPGKARSSKR